MSMFDISDEEITAGVELAKKKYRVTINRTLLLQVINDMQVKRAYDRESFRGAREFALDKHHITEFERRNHFKSAIGAVFNARRRHVEERRLRLRRPASQIPVVLEGRQYAFAIMPPSPKKVAKR